MALKIVDKVLWNEARQDYDSATSLRPWDCMMLTTAAADWGRLAIDNATANAYLDQISSSVKRFARTKPDVLVGCIPFREVLVVLDSQRLLYDGEEAPGRRSRRSAKIALQVLRRLMHAFLARAAQARLTAINELGKAYLRAANLPMWVKMSAASGVAGTLFGGYHLIKEHVGRKDRGFDIYPPPDHFRNNVKEEAIISRRRRRRRRSTYSNLYDSARCKYLRALSGHGWLSRLLGLPALALSCRGRWRLQTVSCYLGATSNTSVAPSRARRSAGDGLVSIADLPRPRVEGESGTSGTYVRRGESIVNGASMFGGPTWDIGLAARAHDAHAAWRKVKPDRLRFATVSCMHHLDHSLVDLGLGDPRQAYRMRQCLTPFLPPLTELGGVQCENNTYSAAGVNCGSHTASDCSKCPCNQDGHVDVNLCDTDCMWSNNICQLRTDVINCTGVTYDSGHVNCGGHMSGACSTCPCTDASNVINFNFCNGDCVWNGFRCAAKTPPRRKRFITSAVDLIVKPATGKTVIEHAAAAISTAFCELSRPPTERVSFRMGYNMSLYSQWEGFKRCRRSAVPALAAALGSPAVAADRVVGPGPSDSLGSLIDEDAFVEFATNAGCTFSDGDLSCSSVTDDDLGNNFGCHLVRLIRNDLFALAGSSASRSRLSIISCEECRHNEPCRNSDTYRSKCRGGPNRLLLSTGSATRQRLAVNLGLLENGFGCRAAPISSPPDSRGRRNSGSGFGHWGPYFDNHTRLTFERMFAQSDKILHASEHSCLAKCGSRIGPCLACPAGQECRLDPFSGVDGDYQCLEAAPNSGETLEGMLFRQRVTVITTALDDRLLDRTGQLGGDARILGATCNSTWTPLFAVRALLTSPIAAAAQGDDPDAPLRRLDDKIRDRTAVADDALDVVWQPLPSHATMMAWRGDEAKRRAVEATAAAAAAVMPRLELLMLAARAATLRATNVSDDRIAAILPARTLVQPDFLRAASLVDYLRNDDETDCVTKQIAIMSFVFSSPDNLPSGPPPPNLSGIKGLLPCRDFADMGDVGSALGHQMGWLGCLDNDGELTSYLNFTAERIREDLLRGFLPHILKYSADARNSTTKTKRAAHQLSSSRVTTSKFGVLAALAQNDLNSVIIVTRERRSIQDIRNFRNYCRWAGSWITRLLGLNLPCMLHDTLHLMGGGHPDYITMYDTPANTEDFDVPEPVVTQLFSIPVPIFTPQLRLTRENLAGHLSPSDTDCEALDLGHVSNAGCFEHQLSRCAWMYLHVAARATFDIFAAVAPSVCRDVADAWFFHRLVAADKPAWRNGCANSVSSNLSVALQRVADWSTGGYGTVTLPARLHDYLWPFQCKGDCIEWQYTTATEFIRKADTDCRGLITIDWRVEAVRLNPEWHFERTLQPEFLNLSNPDILNALTNKLQDKYYNGFGKADKHTRDIVDGWYTEEEWRVSLRSSASPGPAPFTAAWPRATAWCTLGSSNIVLAALAVHFSSRPAAACAAAAVFMMGVSASATTPFDDDGSHYFRTAAERFLADEAEGRLPGKRAPALDPELPQPLLGADWSKSAASLPGSAQHHRDRQRRSPEDRSYAPTRFAVKEINNAVIYHRDVGNTAAVHRYHNIVIKIPTQPVYDGVHLLDKSNRHQFSIDHPGVDMPDAMDWSHNLELPRETVNLLLRQDKVVKLNNSFNAFAGNIVKSLDEHLTDAIETKPESAHGVHYYPWINNRKKRSPVAPGGRGPRGAVAWAGMTVVTIIGNLLMSLLNGSQVRQLQTQFLKISDSVSDGMSRVAQMGGTVECLANAVSTFQKVFLRKNTQWDFTILWDQTFEELESVTSNTMEVVASAAAQTLHPILLTQVDAQELALKLARLRMDDQLVPIIATSAELSHMETTLGVVKDDVSGHLRAFQIVTAIPLVEETSQLALFRHVNVPLQLQDNTFVFLYPRYDRTVAVTMRALEPEQRLWTTLSGSELAACRNVRRHFICPELGALRPTLEDSPTADRQDSDVCAYALYAGLTSLALATCARAKVTDDTVVRKVGPFHFLIYVRVNTEIHVSCNSASKAHNEGQSFRVNRMAEITVPPGCTARANGYTMSSEDERYADKEDTFYDISVDGDFTGIIQEQLAAAASSFERRAAAGPPNATAAFFDALALQAGSTSAAAHAIADNVRQDAEHFHTRATAVSGTTVAGFLVLVLVPLFTWLACRVKRSRNNQRAVTGGLSNFDRTRTVCDLQVEITALRHLLEELSLAGTVQQEALRLAAEGTNSCVEQLRRLKATVTRNGEACEARARSRSSRRATTASQTKPGAPEMPPSYATVDNVSAAEAVNAAAEAVRLLSPDGAAYKA